MSWESSGWHAPDGGPVGPPRVPAARRALLGSLRFEALEAHRQIPLAAVLGVRGLLQDASGLAQFNTLELRIAARHAGPALGRRLRPRAVGTPLVERWYAACERGAGLSNAELCVLSRARLASARRALGERVQVRDEGCHRTLEAQNPRVVRFDQVVLIRRVRPGSVAQAEVTHGQAQRRIGEDIARPGARAARPRLRIVPQLAIGRELRADQTAVGVGLRRVVTAAHVDLDVCEAALGEVRLQLGEGIARQAE